MQEIIEEKEQSISYSGSKPKAPSLPGNMNLNAGKFSKWKNPHNRIGQAFENKNDDGNLWGSKIQKIKDSSKGSLKESAPKMQPNDSARKDGNSKLKKINAKKEELKKLQDKIKTEKNKLHEVKKSAQNSLNNLKREISSLNSSASLYDFMKRNGISKDSLTKTQKLLLSFRQVGIGRIYLDYSELTVKNMSLTGVNMEANPGNFYFAAAAGKVNYRFRDFVLKDHGRSPPQSLYILRAGIGQKEKKSLIFSFYNGKKNELFISRGGSAPAANKVLGISAEARWAFDANNYVIAEVAKSSYGNLGALPPNSGLLNKALDLKTHTNESYSIKLFTQYPATHTKGP